MGKFQSSKVFDGFQPYSVNGEQKKHIVVFYMVMVFHLKYTLKVI